MSDLTIRIAFFLGFLHQFTRNSLQLVLVNFCFQVNQFFDLLQKPLIDFRQVLDRTERNTEFEGVVDVKQSIPAWVGQGIQDLCLVFELFAIRTQAISFDF